MRRRRRVNGPLESMNLEKMSLEDMNGIVFISADEEATHNA